MLQLQAFAIVLIVLAAGHADAQHHDRGICSCEVVTVTSPEPRLMREDETKVGWVWHHHVHPSTGQVDEPEATHGAYRCHSYEPRRVAPLFDRQPISSEVRRRRPTPPETRLRPGSRRW